MSERKYEFLSVKQVKLEEVESLLEEISNKFTNVNVLGTSDLHNLYFEKLSRCELLDFKSDINIKDLMIEGVLNFRSNFWETLEDVLLRLDERIREYGGCIINIDYKGKVQEDNKRAYDSIGLRIEQNQCSFSFYANGSKISSDKEYGKRVIKELIELIGLDIIVEESEGFFRLTSDTKNLKILAGGLFGKNPSAFYCEIDESSPKIQVKLLKKALEFLYNEKVLSCSWKCYPIIFDNSSFGNHQSNFIDVIREQNLPADYYNGNISVSIEKLLNFDELQKLCISNSSIFTRLVTFDIDNSDLGEILVETTKSGHRLHLEFKNEESKVKVLNNLRVDFKELNN
ncbi:hypothetical protein L3081_20075 [Colwellia sp. MSW7]|uniref:Uncharacterized protein n=1 Tax=Colwellia maritima TaxID=2912588 RepID=A0ABS9X4W7_9GAMM|nr:hypothetical protein [Colwellia maritima]MCI2285256.1 hypothetical protein [Colwellia maritima]